MFKHSKNRKGFTMTTYNDGTGKWHSETIESYKSKTIESLTHIIWDCEQAIKALPQNPKCPQYQDEIHYASMEIASRCRALQAPKLMLVCNKCKTDHISACHQNHQLEGFDVWCWSCDKPSNKIEMEMQG